ncbi:MAG: diguanylate cyclase [Burkholderiales bacterium]|nr:diguanylate cyclase [Burkholderiales bacterium]
MLLASAWAFEVPPAMVELDRNPARVWADASEELASAAPAGRAARMGRLATTLVAAMAARSLGRLDEANKLLDTAQATSTDLGDTFGLAMSEAVRAQVYADTRGPAATEPAARQALSLAVGLPDEMQQALVREYAAWALAAGVGRYGDAEPHFRYAMGVYQRHGAPIRVAACMAGMATIHMGMGDDEGARREAERAYAMLDHEDAPFVKMSLELMLGQDYLEGRDFPMAAKLFARALASAQTAGADVDVAVAYQGLALTAMKAGEWARAERYFALGQPVLHDHGLLDMWAVGQAGWARVRAALGRTDIDALLAPARAQMRAPRHDMRYLMFIVYEGQALRAVGRGAEAAPLFERAIELQNELDSRSTAAHLAELTVRYGVQRKDDENAKLKLINERDRALINERTASQRLMGALLALAVVTLASLAYFLRHQIRRRRHFAHLALVDTLTGAPNRRAMLELVQTLHERGAPLLLGIVDLDLFKAINDRHGHETGDRVLQSFYQAARMALRPGEHLGRLGGEEWLFVAETFDAGTAAQIFARLRERVRAWPIEGLGEDEPISFSMGTCVLQPGQLPSAAMAAADDALYIAKASGRDRLHESTPEPHPVTIGRRARGAARAAADEEPLSR